MVTPTPDDFRNPVAKAVLSAVASVTATVMVVLRNPVVAVAKVVLSAAASVIATVMVVLRNPNVVAKAVLSATASVAATVVVVWSVLEPHMPTEFLYFLFSGICGFLSRFSNKMTMVIEDWNGFTPNELFPAAQVFLAAKQSPSVRRMLVTKSAKENHFALAMDKNQAVVDTFRGVELKWLFKSRRLDLGHPAAYHARTEVQYFELTFHKTHREMVVESYLPFVMDEAKSLKKRKKTVQLYTTNSKGHNGDVPGVWAPVKLDHPATFNTLAMDLELKKKILNDLDRFVGRKEYYRRVGKAWKRGYLLYGPPGTGKSSLVAAIANHLNFDIYDLDLSGIRSNEELRRLLIATMNQSILVVEDIDCTIKLEDRMLETRATRMNPMSTGYQRQDGVTLSGFLNFIDGLWSGCGDERIIIFTTNHIEKLDPALLRPGRMDLHVPMSYCTPCGFRLLASNYLEIDHHDLFDQIESAIATARVTPAEVAEQLMQSDKPEVVLGDMVSFLANHKSKENEEKVRRSQLMEENGGSQEESSECELIEK